MKPLKLHSMIAKFCVFSAKLVCPGTAGAPSLLLSASRSKFSASLLTMFFISVLAPVFFAYAEPVGAEEKSIVSTEPGSDENKDTREMYNKAVLRDAGLADIPDSFENDFSEMIKQEDLSTPSTTDPVLRDADSVEIFVSEDPSFNGVYTITRGGYVIIPQVGHFKVGGMTLKQAEQALKQRLEQDLLRSATVSMILTSTISPEDGKTGIVYVIGEVVSPGIVRIPHGERLTMLTAILRAGGLAGHADSSNIQLARLEDGRRNISTMDFDAVLSGHARGTELFLQHGDIVNVTSRTTFDPNKPPPPTKGTVYLSGRVKNPGPHDIMDTSVYRTILRYGGFDRFANLRRVYVLRMQDGVQIKIPVNIHKIIRSGALDLDVNVKPGDIIVVPEKFFSF